MTSILLVDDDKSIRSAARMLLEGEGYDYLEAASGAEGLAVFQRLHPDLIILDVMMEGMNGYDVCARIREADKRVPVLFLTARGDIVDKGMGFQVGGDDYLVKPFISQELLYRVRALLRRASVGAEPRKQPMTIVFEDLSIDVKRRRVSIGDRPVELTPKEFHVLQILASSPGEVFTRERLIEDVWGPEFVGESTSLAVIIRRIREKIEDDPSLPHYLQTVWHVGYRMGD